jgi:hypothetical protein
MRTAPLILFVAVVAGALEGCSEYKRTVPELSFANASPLVFGVREAQIDPRYRSSDTPPNIEQTVDPTPEAALIKWAQQRLRADGSENIARFTILNASLVAGQVTRSSGTFGGLETGQRWTLTLEAQMEILDEAGNRLDGSTAKVTRTRDVPPKQTYDQRKLFWYDMLSATMSEFDAEMNSGVRQYLGKWLRS